MKSIFKVLFAFFAVLAAGLIYSFTNEADSAFAIASLGGFAVPMGRRSRAEVEKEARMQLSNLNGHSRGATRNPLLDSDGPVVSQAFRSAIGQARTFTIKLTNSNAANRTVLLCPGVIENAAGLIATGAFNDTGGNAGVTGLGAPESIEVLNAYLQKNPGMLFGIKITSTDANQLQESITIQPEHPFGKLANQIINISNYIDGTQFNDKVAVVPVPFQMDNQTKISIPILGGASPVTTTIVLYFGPFLNTAKTLSQAIEDGQY